MSPETMTRREASRDKRTVQSALPRAIEVIFCRLKAQIEKPCVRFLFVRSSLFESCGALAAHGLQARFVMAGGRVRAYARWARLIKHSPLKDER